MATGAAIGGARIETARARAADASDDPHRYRRARRRAAVAGAARKAQCASAAMIGELTEAAGRWVPIPRCAWWCWRPKAPVSAPAAIWPGCRRRSPPTLPRGRGQRRAGAHAAGAQHLPEAGDRARARQCLRRRRRADGGLRCGDRRRSRPLGLTETRLGLIPATIGPYVLARMGDSWRGGCSCRRACWC